MMRIGKTLRRSKDQEFICPQCHQDMREEPKPGLNGKNCNKCGQGLSWRKAARLKSRIT